MKKLFECKMMLTKVAVSDVDMAPNGTMLHAMLALTFTQSALLDGEQATGGDGGGGGGSGGSGSKKASVKKYYGTSMIGTSQTSVSAVAAYQERNRAAAVVNRTRNAAKAASKNKAKSGKNARVSINK